MSMSKMEKELHNTLDQLQVLEDALLFKGEQKGVSHLELMDPNGVPIMVPILLARSNAILALVVVQDDE